MNKIYNILLSACLAAGIFTSCSEDAMRSELPTGNAETGSITFSLSGLDMGMDLSTRSAERVDLDKYGVKCFVFYKKHDNTRSIENYILERKEDVNSSVYTVDDLKTDGDYIFAFLAAEKAYVSGGETDYLTLKTGMYNPQEANETSSEFRYCYIPAFDESERTDDGNGSYKVIRVDGATDDFMVWGVSYYAPSELVVDGTHTPQDIILTRQMGAIQFSASEEAGEVTECSVFSNYYRLYLPQMLNTKDASVACTTTETSPFGDPLSDFAGNYVDASYSATYVNITKSFKGDNYLYVPCTTLKNISEEIPDVEHANTLVTTLNNGGNNVPKNPTSVTIGGQKYQTESPFPVFPNRKTILKVNDGKTLEVIYGGNDGIDLDDNEWDGIH